jgi:uncharacterized protein involved in exopolysaccharide biosynthesis
VRSWSAVLFVSAVACRNAPKEATGTFVLEVSGSDTRDAIDARVANAIELLQSRAVAQRVSERIKSPTADVVQHAVHARRRADSTVIEVAVALPDPIEAASVCNNAIMTLVELEREKQLVESQNRARVLADLLDKLPAEDPRRKQLGDELVKIEIERTGLRATVRPLDPCLPPAR